MTDERALKLARKIAADIWELDASNRQAVLNGEYDSIRQVRSALAAIKLTTQLAAEKAAAVINDMRDSGESDLRSARSRIESAFRNNEHLPADGGENV